MVCKFTSCSAPYQLREVLSDPPGQTLSCGRNSVKILVIKVSPREHDFPPPACYCITQEISNLASNPGKHFLAHVAVLSCWPSLEGEKEEAEDEPAAFKPFSAFCVPCTGKKDSCLLSGEWLGHVGGQSSRSLALVSREWCSA